MQISVINSCARKQIRKMYIKNLNNFLFNEPKCTSKKKERTFQICLFRVVFYVWTLLIRQFFLLNNNNNKMNAHTHTHINDNELFVDWNKVREKKNTEKLLCKCVQYVILIFFFFWRCIRQGLFEHLRFAFSRVEFIIH